MAKAKKKAKKVSAKKSKVLKAKVKKSAPKKVAVKKAAPKKTVAKKLANNLPKKPVSKVSRKLSAPLFQPCSDGVLVLRSPEERKTASGLFIPDSALEKPLQGKVIAVGPGRTNKKGRISPMDVMVGDEVLLSQYSGNEVQLGGQDYLLVREGDILGVLE